MNGQRCLRDSNGFQSIMGRFVHLYVCWLSCKHLRDLLSKRTGGLDSRVLWEVSCFLSPRRLLDVRWKPCSGAHLYTVHLETTVPPVTLTWTDIVTMFWHSAREMTRARTVWLTGWSGKLKKLFIIKLKLKLLALGPRGLDKMHKPAYMKEMKMLYINIYCLIKN